MSDSRIHLSISYHKTEPEPNYNNWFEIRCFYPNLDEVYNTYIEIHQSKFIDKKLKGIEALVRSLVKGDQYIASEFETKFGKNCLSCKNRRSEYVMTKDWICHSCKKYKMHESLPNHYDTKLKVTFGAGTFSIWFEEPYIRVIEPLQPIEKVCKDLGVEINYVQQ